jgi:hypothetical protein
MQAGCGCQFDGSGRVFVDHCVCPEGAVFGIRYEGGHAWIDVCDANGVHSVALDPGAAVVTGQALLDFGRRQITNDQT